MNLRELIDSLNEFLLEQPTVNSVQTGGVFDIATSKSSDTYNAVWIELPILIDYNDSRKKTYTLSLNFLSLCDSNDIDDVINKTSMMEVLCDKSLQSLREKYMNIGLENIQGLTLRNFSDDDLVGVRTELTFIVARECAV